MTENVFIAWGRNLELAVAVRDLLKKNGYFPTVGGMFRGAQANTFFINSNVLRQMDDASFAIVLAQRIFDAKGQPTGEFRPNLMFEWGYLQGRLRADAIHVFLINIGRDELPSDLQNAYTHTINIDNALQPTVEELNAAAGEIVHKFVADIANIDFDGLEILQNYDSYRTRLSEIKGRTRAFNSREVGYYLLHMIQPAFYRNDFSFIKDCLAEFVRMATGQFIDVAILIDQIIAYYELTDRIGELDSLAISDDLRGSIRVLEDIESKLNNLRSKKDKIYNIFDVLLEDFLGLCNLRVYMINKNAVALDRAIASFTNALKECGEFQSVHMSNVGFVRTLWEAYIERNLARAYYYKGDTVVAEKTSMSAEQKRLNVSSQLGAARVDWLARQFSIEIGLSQFDRMKGAGINENDLSDLVARYIEPNVPRGIDRVWDRLHGAIEKSAKEKGYNGLLDRLASVKR